MSIPVYFKNVNKRENSNDRFSIVGMTPVNVIFKAGTSLTHPSFEIQVDNTTDVVTYSQYNEVYVQSFDRYYFIRDWVNKGRKMICNCEVDVLASFWNDIKDQTFYIQRSTQAYNPDLPDGMYPTVGGYSTSVGSATSPLAVSSGTSYGCFVVGVINNQGGLGGVDYYIMSYLVFISFCQKLFNISNFGTFTDITDDVAKLIINPFQYITQCFWLPWEPGTIHALGYTTSTTNVYMGYWTLALGATCYYLDNSTLSPSYTTVMTINVHKHPLAATRGNYLNLAPYSKYSLYFYPFGMIDLDPLELYAYSTVYAVCSVDLRSGMGVLRLSTSYSGTNYNSFNTDSPFKVVTAQVGVEIGVASLKYYVPTGAAQIVANVAVGAGSYGGFTGFMDKLVGSAIAGAADVAQFFGADPGAVSDVKEALSDTGYMLSGKDLGNIVSSAVTARNTAECLGMTAAISFLNQHKFCILHKYLTISQASDDIGRPACAPLALTTFTTAGFILCSNAHPQVSRATLTEKRQLTNMLNSGFYVTGT